MITNLLQVAVYQKLAFQLMLGEVDQLAQELKLPVPLPIQQQQVVDAYVGAPQFGVNGSLQISNVAFTFWGGRLHTITRLDVNSPLNMTDETIAKLPPTADLTANEAYQLATQWLGAISVDVSALEKKFRPKISQQAYKPVGTLRPRSQAGPVQDSVQKTIKLFEIEWSDGKRKEFEPPTIQINLLGNTRELIKLRLTDSSFLQRPLIVATNADFQGVNTNLARLFEKPQPTLHRTPVPEPWAYPRWAPPRSLTPEQLPEWMARFFGGEAALQTLTHPERVNAYVLKKYDPFEAKSRASGRFPVLKYFQAATEYPIRRGPVPVKLPLAEELGGILTDAFSYQWHWRREFDEQYLNHGVRYDLRLEFIRQTNTVDVVFAVGEPTLRFYSSLRQPMAMPEMSFQPKQEAVRKLLKEVSR